VKPTIEYCCACNAPTDRAGSADDSLYTSEGIGPFCSSCYDGAVEVEKEYLSYIAALRTDLDAANAELTQFQNKLDLEKMAECLWKPNIVTTMREARKICNVLIAYLTE